MRGVVFERTPDRMTLHFPVKALLDPPVSNRPLTLGFLCPHNPFDRTAFSGTAFFAARALANHPAVNLKILGNHTPRRLADRLADRIGLGKTNPVDPEHLHLDGLDALLGLVASPALDRLIPRLKLPFIHVTDATPGFLRDAYGWDIPAQADEVERRVAAFATTLLYSSKVMANRARGELGSAINAQSAPFGINMENLPNRRPPKPPADRLELLIVCSDWHRKGGDRALAVLDALRAGGRQAHLHVVGQMPKDLSGRPDVSFAGYLNKNRPRDAARLGALYARAHLFLLPSRGDCTPMVVGEAMAHGTPVLASDTGGMSDLVAPGTGRIMGTKATPEDWACAATALTENPESYLRLSRASFTHARENLSWENWAGQVVAECRNAITPARAA